MDDSTMRELLAAVREACSSSTWSQAVEMCRAGAVVGEHATDEEVRVRVTTDKGLISPAVVLWPEEMDWTCDCDTGGACVHVAAAVIALRQAQKDGKALPFPKEPSGRVAYRFTRSRSALSFHRCIVTGDSEVRVDTTLVAIAEGKVPGPRFIADQADLAVERILLTRLSGVLQRTEMSPLLDALGGCPDIRLDNKPIRVGAPCAPLHARLEDCAEGFRLVVEQDPNITEIFDNGVVLCGDILRSIGDAGINAREMQEMRNGRIYAFHESAELMTDVLPSLQERIPVTVTAKRLPRLAHNIMPRIVLETRRENDTLAVLPTIVYGNPVVARVDGERLTHLQGPLPLRRKDREQALARALDAELGMTPGHWVRAPGAEGVALMRRIEQFKPRAAEVAGDGPGAFFLAPPLDGRLEIKGRTFEVFFESQDERDGATVQRHAEPGAVISAWQRGESLVPLIEGGFATLPADWLSRFGARLADLLATRQMLGNDELPTHALPDLARLCMELEQPVPPEFDRLKQLVDGFTQLPQSQLPADLRVSLRGYQRSGVDWLSFLRDAGLGAMLADDMGLGKTVQALTVMRGRCLVVAPTSVLHNWIDEIERFRPGVRWSRYHGAGRTLDANADITITTYAILRLDADLLSSTKWDAVVLDEAQNIKNPDSQVARAAFRLDASFRVTLSGTPVENRLEELWSQFHFLNRGLLGGRSDFQERYGKPILEGQPGAAPRLRERIRPFVLRRLKSEVAPELPPRTEVVLRACLQEVERSVYDTIRASTVPSVVEKLQAGGSVMLALEALLRLRQACCHPALIPGQTAESSSKIELLLELLDEGIAEGHKALVFSQWTSMLDLIEPHLNKAEVPFVRLDGSTQDRRSVVEKFQASDGPPVMLVSLRAGGTGLNLTAADHIFLLDPWWNPAVEDQAADRAHRIGQQRPVMVHRLVAEDTVEERILELQERKRAVSEAALGDSDQAIGLTRDDLLAVLA